MDGHMVHDDGCPESWQAQATIRKSQTVALDTPAPALAEALWLLTDAMVQLEDGKIKTRRNRAGLIRAFLAKHTKGDSHDH